MRQYAPQMAFGFKTVATSTPALPPTTKSITMTQAETTRSVSIYELMPTTTRWKRIRLPAMWLSICETTLQIQTTSSRTTLVIPAIPKVCAMAMTTMTGMMTMTSRPR